MKFLSKTTSENSVTFSLGNGQNIRAFLSELPQNTVIQLAVHGLSQKVGDSAAGFAASQDYSGAREAMLQTYESLKAGEWNRRGEGVGKEDIILAVCEITSKSEDEVRGKATPEKLKEWAKNKAVKANVAQRVADRATEKAQDEADELEV